MADLKTPEGSQEKPPSLPDDIVIGQTGEIINASGHRDQLDRQYGILSICGMALTVDNAWVAIGTSLNVAIYNGGPPGVLYAFLAASFYYCFIAASLAEVRNYYLFTPCFLCGVPNYIGQKPDYISSILCSWFHLSHR